MTKKSKQLPPTKQKGSSVLLVLILSFAVMMILASVLSRGISSKKINMSNALYNEAKNGAESYAEYGCADVVRRFESKTSFPSNEFDKDAISVPDTANSFFAGSNVNLSATEVKGGEIKDGYWIYLDADDPRWELDPMKGKRVFVRDVNIFAKATAKSDVLDHQSTAFVQQTLQVRDSPLFSYAIFYNMDLELHPGPPMHIYGPVHTNKTAWVESNNGIWLHDTLTASAKILHGNPTDSTDPHTQSNSVYLRDSKNSFFDMKLGSNTSSDANWLDHRDKDWRQKSSQTWNGYVQDSAHNVPIYNAAGIADYIPDDLSTTSVNELENHAYAVIEPILPYGHPDRKSKSVRNQKMAAKAGLILRVELDGTTTSGLKIRAYKWKRLNSSVPVNPQAPFDDLYTDGNGDPQLEEIELPSSDLFPSLLSSDLIGKEKSDLSAVDNPSSGAEPAIYKYSGGVEQGLYDHRQNLEISTVTLDVGVLRKVMDDNANPVGTNLRDTYWKNPTTKVITYDPKTDWNGVVYVQFPIESNSGGAKDKIVKANPDLTVQIKELQDVQVPTGNMINGDPIYDWEPVSDGTATHRWSNHFGWITWTWGSSTLTHKKTITGYKKIEEMTTEQQWVTVSTQTVHLALQLINGEYIPSPSFRKEPGLTIATNAPVYLMGNYNADGVTHTDDAQLIEHNHYKNSSGNYFDEPPASIMCDTYTQLSKNWPNNRRYSQENSTSNRKAKFTEVSAAILTGLSPTIPDSGKISGGAHNFPRFLENWDSVEFSLRTSMVALYENEVHTVPMPESGAGDYYAPPLRDWGFNENFEKGIYPPGTPNARTFRRTKFEDITEEEYIAGTSFKSS